MSDRAAWNSYQTSSLLIDDYKNMKPHIIDCATPIEADMLGEVRAGFPSPADEEPRERLDLVQLLVRHPASTFFFRIGGTSMVDAEMDEGDIIIVDRSIEPYKGCSAVCFIDGEFTVKRVDISERGVRLIPANHLNTKYQPIEVSPENQFMIWGVVTYIIKKM